MGVIPMSERKPRTAAADFIRVWQSAATLDEVAQKLGYEDRLVASQNASRLRKRGIPLKQFSNDPSLDIEALKALAEELAPK